jgi:uncharacterized membrane protein required for colicin V production
MARRAIHMSGSLHGAGWWLTAALLVYLLWGALTGWRRGLVLVGMSLVGYVVGVSLALHDGPRWTAAVARALRLGHLVAQFAPLPVGGHPVHAAMVATARAVLVAAEWAAGLVGRVVTAVVRRLPLIRGLNGLGGLAGGLLEHALVAGIVLGLAISVPFVAQGPIGTVVRSTPAAHDLVRWVGALIPWPPPRGL